MTRLAEPDARAAPPGMPAASAQFVWPVRGRIIAGFGASAEGTHNEGINIAAPRGAPVEAAASGVVVYAGNELPGYGNLILIRHADGWISAYAHLDAMLVKPREKVARGAVIGRVGATGSVGAPQLHFELRRADRAVDPLKYLPPSSTASAPTQPRRG
jgi:murein DD-endopeptidase MepM/ murein hydrolase activator NlpD